MSTRKLVDKIVECNHKESPEFPQVVKLNSKEKLVRRKVPTVLRYFVPNQQINPEDYAHHLLFLFYPFRSEVYLQTGGPPSYQAKLLCSGVIGTINENRRIIEPFAELVEAAFARFHADMSSNLDAFANDDVQHETCSATDQECVADVSVESNISSELYCSVELLPDTEINRNIRSLNMKQRQIFDYVHGWANAYMKGMNCLSWKSVSPILLVFDWWRWMW